MSASGVVGRLGAAAALAGLSLGCAFFGPAPAWEQPAPEVHEGPVVKAGTLHRSVLPNGMKILVLEDHRLPRISLGVVVRRGALLEDNRLAGQAAFMTELMERGAGGRDALELAEAVDAMGASLGVGSDWDSSSVSVSGLSRDIDALFEILADVTLRPTFAEAEVKKTRNETLASLERAKDNPRTLAGWEFAKQLYGTHRFGLPMGGNPETVARLDRKAAQAIHKQLFVASDAIFVASGDVTAAEIEAKAATAFGAWESGTAAQVPPPPQASDAERRVVIVDRPDLGQATLLLGHAGISRTEPERIPIALMNNALGSGGFSSRLMTRIREDEGLAYSVYSNFSLRRYPGPFVVSTATRAAEVGRTVEIVIEELERMRAEGPTAEELRNAQTYSVGRFGLSLETSGAVAGSLVDLDVFGLPEDSLDTYRARVRAVGPADVARASQRLHPDRLAIIAVGPAQAMKSQLEAFGPVEVVTP